MHRYQAMKFHCRVCAGGDKICKPGLSGAGISGRNRQTGQPNRFLLRFTRQVVEEGSRVRFSNRTSQGR